MNTLEPEEVDLAVLYQRVQKLKMEELFSEPYDPPEDLEDAWIHSKPRLSGILVLSSYYDSCNGSNDHNPRQN